MKYANVLRGVIPAIVMASLPVNALAQVVPGGSVNTAQQPAPIAAQPESYVLLGDLPPSGGTPHAARSFEVDRNTPVVSRSEFMRRYPAQGAAGFDRISAANEDLCGESNSILDEIGSIRTEFQAVDDDYAALQQVYEALPGSMKRHAIITTVAQAGSTGALCALTAGLYCIAAAVAGGGNILSIHGSLKMQLANIRLSQANLRHSRTTIKADLVWARATTLWVRMVAPYCTRYYPNARRPGW